MSLEPLSRLEYLDDLINRKATGPPSELATKLQVSQRWVYEQIKILKDRGAPIQYDRKRRSYYYAKQGGFNFRFIESK